MDKDKFQKINLNYEKFLNTLKINETSFKFSNQSYLESSFGLCFAVFGYHLLANQKFLKDNKKELTEKIKNNFDNFYNLHKSQLDFSLKDKKVLQLFCFSLSALSILDENRNNRYFHELIEKVINIDLNIFFKKNMIFEGHPTSGNLSMFIAIILIYADNYLGLDIKSKIEYWIECHLKNINSNGVWSQDKNFSYKHFQNSYHQYEIFNYLNIETKYENLIAKKILQLKDTNSQFAPYLGGGSCYDYDAIFFLTNKFTLQNDEIKKTINKNMEYIMNNQNDDGGFGERLYKKHDISFYQNIEYSLKNYQGIKEKLLFCLILLRKKNKLMFSAFDNTGKTWFESSLWDSWFRMLTINKIYKNKKSFINFPGIGYY